jgi:hypothetical protein
MDLAKIMKEHPPTMIAWSWYGLSQNHSLTMQIVEKHPYRCWDWAQLSANPNMTTDFIERHPELLHCWHLSLLRTNPAIPSDFVVRMAGLIPEEGMMHQSNGTFALRDAKRRDLTVVIDDYNSCRQPWTKISACLGGTMELAEQLRKEGKMPHSLPGFSRMHNTAVCKAYLGSPLDKPIDYFCARLWLLIVGAKASGDSDEDRFVRIVQKMPPELQERLCAAVYWQRQITVKTLQS